MELNWSVLPHLPYLPDLVPTDYYYFFNCYKMLWLGKLSFKKPRFKISSQTKPEEFYSKGIKELSEKWQQEITNNGKYIII